MILERTDLAIDRLLSSAADAPGDVRMYRFGRSLALEVVLHALFGERMAEHAEELGDLFQRAQDYLEQPAVRQIPHRIPRTARARVRADRQRFDALVDAEIDRRRRHPTGDPFDVLEVLVVDGSLSDAEIRDQVNTLIGAGYDTTAATLAWTIACTASDDSLWRRLRDEADDVLGPIGGDGPGADRSGNDELMRLDLAARTVRETMRLHPAGVLGPREATSDIVVDGRRIARGTLVLWSAHLAGRDPGCWDDPLRFDPDRFVDPTPEQREMANLAWVPFGGGARNCIGFALAQMELTLVISRLAQRVDVELVDAGTPRAVGLVVNRPEGGVPASVRPALTPTRPDS
jgi:cytochrome P450